MCGIFGVLAVDAAQPLQQVTLDALKTLEYRGYDSWGVVWSEKQKLKVVKKTGKIGSATLPSQAKTQIALGHTRWATHGGVTVQNAHPHLDCAQKLAVVHNGIVENYQLLKEKLLKKGHRFTSETDTEVIVHLVEELAQKMPLVEAVKQAFDELEGLNSLVVLEPQLPTLITIKRGSPLVYASTKTQYMIASDAVALAPYSTEVYFLNDGELLEVTAQGARLFDAQLQEKQIELQALEFTAQAANKGEFSDFLSKEIAEQPEVLAHVLAQQPVMEALAEKLSKEPIFIGCGTAYHAALWGNYVWAELAQRFARSYIGSEFGQWQNLVTHDQQPFFISQSGETIDLIEAASALRAKGQSIAAMINRQDSTLERLSDWVIRTPAGPEMAVLATKSFVAQTALLLLLAGVLGKQIDKVVSDLQQATAHIKELLTQEYRQKYIRPLAEKLVKQTHLFTIGRGLSYPIALEAALKIKEVSYLHVEGIAGGDLKHGVIALIENDTPCLVFAPQDHQQSAIISNAMEVKARGAFVVGVAEDANPAFSYHLPVKNAGSASGLVQTVVSQLLAYEIAKMLGRDVDKPRNLAKSVTVK